MGDIDAILANIKANIEQKSRNTNLQAEEDPLHDVADNTVTKSHALSRAYYRFGLVEKRCMEALISKLHPLRGDNAQAIELKASEYAKAFPDVGKHAYEHLSCAVDSLVSRVIVVEKSAGKLGRDKIPLMQLARYEDSEGCITCTFNPLVVPHLIGLREKFSSYPLKKAVNFSSSYTWRFYELLVSWAQPKKDTRGLFVGWFKIEVDELSKMMGVPKSYKWVHFSGMLDKVTSELREKAYINVKIERIKTVRKITHLNIEFIEDSQLQMQLEGGEKPKNKRSRRKPMA